MATLRYLVTGFPGAFVECHRWLTRVTHGGWTLLYSALLPYLLFPGTPAWKTIQGLHTIEFEPGKDGPSGRRLVPARLAGTQRLLRPARRSGGLEVR